MKFEDAVEFILMLEGGGEVTEDPRDPGGLTKWGISQRAFPKLNIRDLSKRDAIKLYHDHYWNPLHLDRFPDLLKLVFFDAAVNQGASAAAGMLQALLGVTVDASIGPKTIDKLLRTDELKVVELYAQSRIMRYSDSKNWPIYGEGWIRRLNQVVFKTFATKIRGES